MFAFLKGFPIGHYVVMAAIAAALWVYGDLILTKQALADQRELTAQWERAATVQANIDRRDTIVIQAADAAEDAVQETENANQPISPDVATAWADGIDRVRDAWTNDAPKHVVPRSDDADASKRDADGRTTSGLLHQTGTSASSMQHSA